MDLKVIEYTCGLGSKGPEFAQVMDPCKHGNEPSRSIESGNVLTS
jgi:hypothetical protein